MAESIRKFDGDSVTCHASAALTGARCVAVTGIPIEFNIQVGPPAAGAKCIGVTATDAASGAKVGVHVAHGQIIPIEVGAGGVTFNDVLEATATGVVITRTTGIPVALATESAAAGAQVLVRWSPALI